MARGVSKPREVGLPGVGVFQGRMVVVVAVVVRRKRRETSQEMMHLEVNVALPCRG